MDKVRAERGTGRPLPEGWKLTHCFRWNLKDGEGYDRTVEKKDGTLDHLRVATILGNYGLGDYAKAWLMSPLEAAAPDLLAALRDMVGKFGAKCYWDNDWAIYDRAQAAIRRAEGKAGE